MTDRQMRAKSFLEQYKKLNGYAEQLCRMICLDEERVDGLKAQAITGMPRGSGGRNGFAEAIVRIEDRRRRYERTIAEAERVRDRIESVIDGVEDTNLKRLLLFRYIDGLKWEDVYDSMCYEHDNVHRLHRKALEAVADIIG